MININRAERRRLERENKSKSSYEMNMINWVQSLTDQQKNVINEVVNEKVRDTLIETDKYFFECIGSTLELLTDNGKEDIELIINCINDLLIKFKHSKMELSDMNKTMQEKIEKECNILIENDLEPLEALDSLHMSFPKIRSSELVKLYKKKRNEFLIPKVKVDMDIELKKFDERKDKLKESNKKSYQRVKEKKKEEVKEKEIKEMNETKTKFRVIEQQVTVETDLGIYKAGPKGVTANIIENENTTFATPADAKKYIGEIIDKLMNIDQEIQDCFKQYVTK